MNAGWWQMAACRDAPPGLFFGADDERDAARAHRERVAKRICAYCPVTSSCLEFALASGARDGVWAGRNEDELLRLRRNRWHNTRRQRAREAA